MTGSIFCLFLTQVEGRSTPVLPEKTAQSQIAPEGKQGILEIPKQAATAIRNFLDQGIRYYLGVTTPPTSPNLSPELQNSIVGNFLLGNFEATLPPAAAYNPQLPGQLTVVQPITASKDPSYYGHSPTVVFVKKTTPVPASPSKTEPPPPASEPQESKNKQRVKPATTGEKVHILDTDTSFNAIFNGLQVSGGIVPKLPPPEITSAEALALAPVPKPVDSINKYKPVTTMDKVHIHVLDTDTTLDGIYSMFGLQLSANSKPKPPPEAVPATVELTTEATLVIEANTEKATGEISKKPVNSNGLFIETDSFLSNPYGITVNKNPDDEAELQLIPETTKASIIIPIQTSTAKPPVKATTEQSSVEGAIEIIPEVPAETTTEEGAVEATTEDEDEEGLREVDGESNASTTKAPVAITTKPVTSEGAVETTTEDEDEEGLGEEDGESKDVTTNAPVTTTIQQVTGEGVVETATEDDEEDVRREEDGSKRKYIFDIL